MWDAMQAAAASGTLPPTTLVVGALDNKYKDESSKAMLVLQGNGPQGGSHRRVVVPGCGHAVHIEAPSALLEVLLPVAEGCST